MASCVYCHARTGKRACPALRGAICPACCGEHRQAEIACPSDCAYLHHGDYQRQRTYARVPSAWIERIMGYERKEPGQQEAMHEVQVSICLWSRGRPDVDRAGIHRGLTFARERMSPIETPALFVPPFGEFLVDRLGALIDERAGVDREGVRGVLDELLLHLDEQVPEESFPEFLRFLRSIYAEHLAATVDRAGPGLIVPG